MKEATVIGNVGKPPEIITLNGSKSFVKFTLACKVSENKTDWVDVTSNNEHIIALVQQYVNKGSKLMIRGYFKASAYINKSGQPVVSENIYIDKIVFLSSKDKPTTSDSSATNDDNPWIPPQSHDDASEPAL